MIITELITVIVLCQNKRLFFRSRKLIIQVINSAEVE